MKKILLATIFLSQSIFAGAPVLYFEKAMEHAANMGNFELGNSRIEEIVLEQTYRCPGCYLFKITHEGGKITHIETRLDIATTSVRTEVIK